MNIKKYIEVRQTVQIPPADAWHCWTDPEHIVHWNFASPDWHCPHATNDLTVGCSFSYRMEAKDGSFGFDFWGTYTRVEPKKRLESTLGDGRTLSVDFIDRNGQTEVVERFEPEGENPEEMQQQGWQAILDNFKLYAESIHR